MGRTKLFSDEDVINNVADVFAAHGYGGTSIAMLTEATGLGKQSLYNSFGDKQHLYLKAVDCTTARYGEVIALMETAPNGMAAIALFFDQLIDACSSKNAAEHSCIVSSGLLEGIADDAISANLCSKWDASQNMLVQAIKRGQADGSIQNTDAPADLADFLMTIVSGLRVSSRALSQTHQTHPTQQSRQTQRLRKTVKRTLSILSKN